jgi:hypothetical protein
MHDHERLFGERLGSVERIDPNHFDGPIVAEHLADTAGLRRLSEARVFSISPAGRAMV